MRAEIYHYVFRDEWKKPNIIKVKEQEMIEYDVPECSLAVNTFGDEKDTINISISIPEWKNVKRFARLVLTPEEAKTLKEQL